MYRWEGGHLGSVPAVDVALQLAVHLAQRHALPHLLVQQLLAEPDRSKYFCNTLQIFFALVNLARRCSVSSSEV